jgi:hypothetical protein
MSWDNVTHKRLRDVAAYLWPDARDCRRLVADSLIDSSRINWDEPPNLRWQSVIIECDKQNTLHKLVPVLLRDYSSNTQLQEACAPWLTSAAQTPAKKKAATPAKVPSAYADQAEEMPVTLESIRADLAIMSRALAELERWRIELSTMSAKNQAKEN